MEIGKSQENKESSYLEIYPWEARRGDRMKFGWLLPILVNRIKSVNISIKNYKKVSISFKLTNCKCATFRN